MTTTALPAPLPAEPDPGPGRRMLALIVALLALPFVLGAALYFAGWQPGKVAAHGRLLSPPPTLPGPWLRETGKNAEKWKLLLRVDGPCAADCTRQLDQLRRIHVALYKGMPRLGRGVLAGQPADPGLADIQRAQPDLTVYAANRETTTALAGVAPPTETILLLDPAGRLVITYPADVAAQGLRADLDRLLKYTPQ